MKNIIISFLSVVIPLFFSHAIYAQPPGKKTAIQPKQNQSQVPVDKKQPIKVTQDSDDPTKSELTLKETQNWLREKISGYSGVTSMQGNISISYRYNSVRFDNNTFMFHVSTKSSIPGWYQSKKNATYPGKTEISSANDVTFALREIDPANIKVVKLPYGNNFGVSLNTVNNKNKIFIKGTITSSLKTYPAKPQDLFPMFQNNNQDTSGACNKLIFVFPDEEIAKEVCNAFIHAVTLSKDESEPFKTDDKKHQNK